MIDTASDLAESAVAALSAQLEERLRQTLTELWGPQFCFEDIVTRCELVEQSDRVSALLLVDGVPRLRVYQVAFDVAAGTVSQRIERVCNG